MGIYHGVFNLTKREWFTGHEFESGAKWRESIHGPPSVALWTLLSADVRDDQAWRGRWIGDRVVIKSDAGCTWEDVADRLLREAGIENADDDGNEPPYGEIVGWTNIGAKLLEYLVQEQDIPCVNPEPKSDPTGDGDCRCGWPLRYHGKLTGVVLREGVQP